MINRAETIKRIKQSIADWPYLAQCPEYTLEMLKSALELLKAQELHGKWVKVYGYATPGGDPVWKCSECGKGIHAYGIEHGSYGSNIASGQWVSCPNCGAKMDDYTGKEGALNGNE